MCVLAQEVTKLSLVYFAQPFYLESVLQNPRKIPELQLHE